MDKITKLRIKYHLHMKVERYFLDETGILEENQKFIQKEGPIEKIGPSDC